MALFAHNWGRPVLFIFLNHDFSWPPLFLAVPESIFTANVIIYPINKFL